MVGPRVEVAGFPIDQYAGDTVDDGPANERDTEMPRADAEARAEEAATTVIEDADRPLQSAVEEVVPTGQLGGVEETIQRLRKSLQELDEMVAVVQDASPEPRQQFFAAAQADDRVDRAAEGHGLRSRHAQGGRGP